MAKRGRAAITICSSAFIKLGRAQAKGLGYPDLPIAVIPHPFGSRTRAEVTQLAEDAVPGIVKLFCESQTSGSSLARNAAADDLSSIMVEAPEDLDELYRFLQERRWGDGLPMMPPTPERVERMLRGTHRDPAEVIGAVAPAFGRATVKHIAINAVLAGCEPEFLPVILAAVEAVTQPQFNLQSVQATTNPATPWLIVNGPIADRLNVNSGINCLGQGNWANATMGRALRLVLQNIGGGLPDDMDRATHGQPGKYSFCCAENEAASPWQPLHVERGNGLNSSAVTVVAAAGTLNINTHAKDTPGLLRMIADAMTYASSNDYRAGGGGEPWIILSPEHADIFKRSGLSKADVKKQLWELSKIPVRNLATKDFIRTQHNRRAELGELSQGDVIPISASPDLIGLLVAGGPGGHSVYVPSYGNTRSVTRAIIEK